MAEPFEHIKVIGIPKKKVQIGIILLIFACSLPAETANSLKAYRPSIFYKTKWLDKNGIKLKNHDINSNDFTDMIPIIKKIGSSNIVLLGEQSHGDGNVFTLKCRLVRFLHEKMGFNILAWEGGLYDCSRVNDGLDSGLSPDEAAKRGIFGVWSDSAQAFPVIDYAARTRESVNPLIIAGIDIHVSSPATWSVLSADIQKLFELCPSGHLNEIQIALLNKLGEENEFIKRSDQDRETRLKFYNTIPLLFSTIYPELKIRIGTRKADFWLHTINNLVDGLNDSDYLLRNKNKLGGYESMNRRDIGMANNLAWLSRSYFKGQKIIVWSASSHTLKAARNIQDCSDGSKDIFKNRIPMGKEVSRLLGGGVYSIAFTAYQGTAGWAKWGTPVGPLLIPPAPEGSLTHCFHQTGYSPLFVDFRQPARNPNHWLHTPMIDRPLGHYLMKADWTRSFDAVIFVDTLEPSTKR